MKSDKDDQFEMKPFFTEISFVLEDLTATNDEPEIIEFADPTPESEAQAAGNAMEFVRSMGHTVCNPYCHPPFGHMSTGAAESIALYLSDCVREGDH